jgi:malate dehydrogenase (oxaloacetate-decarboxylating)(NADP+)
MALRAGAALRPEESTIMAITREEALDYHSRGRPGKIAICPTKPLVSQRDLSLAYTPGVAEPVLEIEKDPQKAYEYTAKGNLVGVISNGTAILGLGDRGPLASKPVMKARGFCSRASLILTSLTSKSTPKIPIS